MAVDYGTTCTALSNGYLWQSWEGNSPLVPSACWLSDLLVDEQTGWDILALHPEAVMRLFSAGALVSGIVISLGEARLIRSGADPVPVALGKDDGTLWARPLGTRELMER